MDHAKSIAQLCRDDHSNVARFGEMGALPRLVGLLGRRGPTVDRAISAALRELGWDEENRSEIAELKVQPLVETLLDLVYVLSSHALSRRCQKIDGLRDAQGCAWAGG